MVVKFKNEVYAIDEYTDVYLVDVKGNVLTKPADTTRKKLVCGVGINDWKFAIGSDGGGHALVYRCWKSMLQRGYDEKCKAHYPTYSDVTVCDEWKSFTTFFNDTKSYMKRGWCLDKDLLFFGNKQYCNKSCIFTPSWLNTLFMDCGSARGDLPQGVYWHKQSGKYQAQCRFDGKKVYLGLFTKIEEASNAYISCKIAYIESKRGEIEEVAQHNNLHTRFSSDFSLTDRVIENFKRQTRLTTS